jgi:peroxiredoxin
MRPIKTTVARFFYLLLFLLTWHISNVNAQQMVSDFNLLNVDGKMVSLSNYPEAKGFIVVFVCNHCPFANLYPTRFNELTKKYAAVGVPLMAISSTDTIVYEEDTYPKMVEKSKREQFNFPYLFDGTQAVAKNFLAEKTPHAYVIWKENNQWVVKYSGAIDDNGQNSNLVENQYIAKAVDALLQCHEVEVTATKSIGCRIIFRE